MAQFDLRADDLADRLTDFVVDDLLMPLVRQVIEGNPRLNLADVEPFLTRDLRRVQLETLITSAHKAESSRHLLELAGIPYIGGVDLLSEPYPLEVERVLDRRMREAMDGKYLTVDELRAYLLELRKKHENRS